MNKGSTFVLRSTVIIIGLIVLGLCLFALPVGISAELNEGADFDYGLIFACLYVPAIPFFYALVQALKLLNLIDKNKVFTKPAVRALQNIKYSGLIISGLFLAGMPYIFYLADRDDAPGVVALGLVIIGASFVIGTAAGLFQQMLATAVQFKKENDLTV